MSDARLARQFAFLAAVDRLKGAPRDTVLMDGSRFENSAEHGWHIALWAMVFGRTTSAPRGLDLDRTIAMALVHDLIPREGDAPTSLNASDQEAPQSSIRAVADQPFGLLPPDQARTLQALRAEAVAGDTTEAAFLHLMDEAQPVFADLGNPTLTQTDRDMLRSRLETGRFARISSDLPELHAHAERLFHRRGGPVPGDLDRRLRFLAEADRLKSVLRATQVFDGCRRENSAEHSWHICLFALVLAEHANRPIRLGRVVQMLVLHDLVEIDAGDAPIHGDHDIAALVEKEQAAADRIFGLLPAAQRDAFRAIWDEFEAAETDDAIFAKSIDRVQPVMANLMTGGGTWPAFNVTAAQLEARVGTKVRRGAPAIWAALRPRIDAWFARIPLGDAP